MAEARITGYYADVPLHQDSRLAVRKLCGKTALPGGAPVRERSPLPNSQKPSTAVATVEPDRLRLIVQRLQDQFYDTEPASVRIATAVLADIKDLDTSPPALPH